MVNKWSQKKTPRLVAKAKKLEAQGDSYREIARKLKVSKYTIRLWLHPDCQTTEFRTSQNRRRQDLRNFKYRTNPLYRIKQLLRVALVKAQRCGYTPCCTPPEEIVVTITENCECCGRHVSECGTLCLDHWHTPPGRFRAWLCNDCNRAIGLFNDSPALLRHAAVLLEQRINE